ncbi:MAG TPA: tRNA uridine-5-carboxymethylaminomethyl(34) synthesis GTPase MnmE [Gemmatimonadales bacterium]|jgi:tRNA modification GTPase|nr:tRNA uridine-5-carboxymethylaminomethyl(34) synthesis GTPase MnmE [Gemmatimonadales bacterium]
MLSDVIAALATPPGRSAIAVVRVSGEAALAVAGRVVVGRGAREPGLGSFPERVATLARFVAADGTPLDEGIVTVFRGPHSYTGDDLVELSCHGGLLAPAQLLAALHAAGARPAVPGEFTRRALLNGKLDLLQAEAVGDLIDATAPAQGRAALQQLEGGLSRRLHTLREGLLELLALLAYEIDFPEEDEGPVSPELIRVRLERITTDARHLLATAPAGERLREGALVVLAGRPNAGKSSLFNALLGTNRALVTEIPGTTRDTIEAASEVVGWPVRLADTAGLREAGERLEQLGIEVSRRYVAAADLLLLCVEAGRMLAPEERELLAERPSLLVRTKADLVPIAERESEDGIPVSIVTGEGLDRLRQAMAERLFSGGGGYAELSPLLTRERHRVALAAAAGALEAARLELGRDVVLVAHQLRHAVAALEELIGVVHPDEVLGRVFERFCVGK